VGKDFAPSEYKMNFPPPMGILPLEGEKESVNETKAVQPKFHPNLVCDGMSPDNLLHVAGIEKESRQAYKIE